MKYRKVWAAGVILLVLMAVSVRLRLLTIPLERDEGEYAYMGQLMLQGVPPYQLAFNIKLPGTYTVYAVIMALFGQNQSGIHLGFLFVNLGNLALLYFLARRFLDEAGVLVCCAAYVLLSLSSAVLGLQAHATHLVMINALGGLLLLLRAREKNQPVLMFLSGLLFGLSFLCKQPGLFFTVLGGALLTRDAWTAGVGQWRLSATRMLLFTAGWAVPLAITCLTLWWMGVFPRFWFWTFVYSRAHASVVPLSFVLYRLEAFVSHGFERWLFLVAFLGWLWMLFQKGQPKFFMTAFLICSFLALIIGRYLAQHYFVVMLPVVSLLVGAAVPGWAAFLGRTRFPRLRAVPVAVFLLICGGIINSNGAVWFEDPPEVACADIYYGYPFVECLRVGEYIREHSKREDRIAVFGSEPEIFFYAQRRSVSGYIYMYDLVEAQPYVSAMKKEFIHDVETAKPEFLVRVNMGPSWMIPVGYNASSLFDWIFSYERQGYDLVGLIEKYPDRTEYRWGSDAAAAKVRNYNAVFVWKRKPEKRD